MGMNIRPPFIYDSLDIPNKKETAHYPRSEWKVAAVIVTAFVLLFVIALAFLIYIYHKINYINQFGYGIEKTLAFILVWSFYTIPLVSIILLLWNLNRFSIYYVRRFNLVNLMEAQTTMDKLAELDINKEFLSIMLESARQSKYKGIQTLTLDESRQVGDISSQQSKEEITEEIIDDLLPAPNEPLLIALQKQGYINRSGDSLFIGFTSDED